MYQDSVIAAYRGYAGLRQIDSFRPWFYQIINHSFKARFRSAWWKKLIPVSSESDTRIGSENPARQYAARRRLDIALSALSPDDRILVTLAELEGWRIAELAELVGQSQGAIKMRLSRARDKMRKKLAGAFCRTDNRNSDRGDERTCCAATPESD